MPIPFLIGAAAVALAGLGAKKGYDASEKNDRAKEISEWCENSQVKASQRSEKKLVELNATLENFGLKKVDIFTTSVKDAVYFVKHNFKDAGSRLESKKIECEFTFESIESSIDKSLEITSGLGKGLASGALAAMGAYSSVGAMGAVASTGTAIGGLSGVAATNATLAWLGGGALSAGGMGMAGGMAVLGGAIAGPALAIAGFTMDSKAEKNLTAAYELEAEVEKVIEEVDAGIVLQDAIITQVEELDSTIDKTHVYLLEVFERMKGEYEEYRRTKKFYQFRSSHNRKYANENNNFAVFLSVLKGLIELLRVPVIDESGSLNGVSIAKVVGEVVHEIT